MDIKKQVEYFKGLPYETKKEKVIEMLKQLQWTNEIFAMFYKTLVSLNKISESVLTYLYQSVMEIAVEIEAGRTDEAQDKIKKMAEVLMMIRKQEEMEREKEGNPEELLKNIK
ncbi:MAG: hypothetical protein WC010_03140 [Candidatus Absconditabacterales bacterium]